MPSSVPTVPRSFFFDPREGKRLAERCKLLNRSISWVGREALAAYLTGPADPVGAPYKKAPKGSPHKLIRIGIAFDPTMADALDARMEAVGRSASWIFRQALTRYLDTPVDKVTQRGSR